MTPFLIVGLPRSRTAWLAKFLSWEGRVCRHEPSLHWTSPDDLTRWAAGEEGASDSMMTWLALDAKKLRPEMPLVVIRRPRHEVLVSLAKLDYPKGEYLPFMLERVDRRLDRIEDEADCLSYRFDQLRHAAICASMFHYCLGADMPLDWWARWKDENVQADIKQTYRLVRENSVGWQAAYAGRHMAAS